MCECVFAVVYWYVCERGVQPNRWLFGTVPFERTRPNRPLFTMPSSVRIVVLRRFQFANTFFPIIIEIMAKATIITWFFVAEIYTKSAGTFRKFDMATFLICKNIFMYKFNITEKRLEINYWNKQNILDMLTRSPAHWLMPIKPTKNIANTFKFIFSDFEAKFNRHKYLIGFLLRLLVYLYVNTMRNFDGEEIPSSKLKKGISYW